MVSIDSLRGLAVAIFGLAAVSSVVLAQTTIPSPSTDPEVAAAIYHVAGNSTQLPTDIVITQPTESTVWYAKSKVSISWTGTKPVDFAFQIINKDQSVKASGMTLLADAKTTAGTATSRIGEIEPGTYFVRLYDPTDISKQFALSSNFIIKAKSDMPGTAQGGVVNSNGTIAGTVGATSTTGDGIAQAGITGQVTNSNSAANPVTNVSSTKAASGSVKDSATSLTQTGFTVAIFLGLAIGVIALQ